MAQTWIFYFPKTRAINCLSEFLIFFFFLHKPFLSSCMFCHSASITFVQALSVLSQEPKKEFLAELNFSKCWNGPHSFISEYVERDNPHGLVDLIFKRY